jgi:NADH:ubiquinone oxidoreductase subunit 6 (subunit J)
VNADWLPWITGAGYGAAIIAVLAAIRVVTGRHLFHSALALGLSLLATAGLYFIIGADVIAAAHILIYVGAILTLIVFAIMLTTGMGDATIPQVNQQPFAGAIISIGLWAVLVRAILVTPWSTPQDLPRLHAADIGTAFVQTYMLPFELISVIFVACLIGAVAISAPRKRDDS